MPVEHRAPGWAVRVDRHRAALGQRRGQILVDHGLQHLLAVVEDAHAGRQSVEQWWHLDVDRIGNGSRRAGLCEPLGQVGAAGMPTGVGRVLALRLNASPEQDSDGTRDQQSRHADEPCQRVVRVLAVVDHQRPIAFGDRERCGATVDRGRVGGADHRGAVLNREACPARQQRLGRVDQYSVLLSRWSRIRSRHSLVEHRS